MNCEVILEKKKLLYTTQELKERGLSHYMVRRLVEQGNLKKINGRVYENSNYIGDSNDFYYANAFVPRSVICLMSAAVFYELSSERLDCVNIAIPRKSRVATYPEWPELKVWYFTNERFDTGIQTIREGGDCFKIYDMEKTVADIVYYREQIGIDETKEVLTTYLRKKERSLNKLICYANKLKCADIMKTYLEMLI